jgi:nucleoside-diphosphate-sugar epimerase
MSSFSSIQRIVVTGSSGTIGTALCEELLRRGCEFTGVDKVPNPWNAEVQRRTIIQDLTHPDSVQKLPESDLVIHLAANARVHFSVKDPHLAAENIVQTMNVLEHGRTRDIPRVLFASSREVYGEQTEPAIDEAQARISAAESPYTASKVAGEAYLAAYRHCYGIKTVIVRFSNVYGRFDNSERVVPAFIRSLRNEEDLTVFGEEKTYDFTFIDDAVAGVMRIVERFDDVDGETFNIATGCGSRLVTVAEQLQQILNVKTRITCKPTRVGELMYYVGDISKAKELLGYEPRVALRQGLEAAVEWHLKTCPPAHTVRA